jgi:hypothetical protein
MSPTSKYIPINTELSKEHFVKLKGTIEYKQKQLAKLKQGDIELSLWYMEQIEYLKQLYQFNIPSFLVKS